MKFDNMKYRLLLLMSALAVLCACEDKLVFGEGYQMSVKEDEPQVEKTENHVYVAGQDGHIYFRIPALIETKSGILLAFCEARNTNADFYKGNESLFPTVPTGGSSKDNGDIDLVVKASRDGGKTWGKMSVIADDKSNTCGNPCPVVDEATGRIHLFWCWQQFSTLDSEMYPVLPADGHTRRVLYSWSDDDGVTWSSPRDLTTLVKKNDWQWYATGPCHAIQVKTGQYKGRLVIPCDHRDNNNTDNYSHCLWSDDNGASWHLGGSTTLGGNESCIAELSDGRLLMNVRTIGLSKSNRASAISSDGGETWTPLSVNDELLDPGCQGSVINVFVDGKPTSTLLLSNCHDSIRSRMSISKSMDDGASWVTGYTAWSGRAAYSDLCQLSDGSIALFYENGFGMFGRAYPNERITFLRLPKDSAKKALGIYE